MQKTIKKASKRALCVGINVYPYEDNNLNGCVNDAHAWAKLLTENFGFSNIDVKLLIDNEATKTNIITALKDLLTGAGQGDTIVFTNSSHGSYVADLDGDELKYDEILCPYDIDSNHICDDELRELIAEVNADVNLTVILDNCFSGTATRAPLVKTPDDRRKRFLSPALRGGNILNNPFAERAKARTASKNKYPEEEMKEILLSGCSDKEYSYDALFDDKYHGAMTYYAMQAIKEADYKLTYAQLHERILSKIELYPQTPQLEGNITNKGKQIFS